MKRVSWDGLVSACHDRNTSHMKSAQRSHQSLPTRVCQCCLVSRRRRAIQGFPQLRCDMIQTRLKRLRIQARFIKRDCRVQNHVMRS
jgi:hypothetical protein